MREDIQAVFDRDPAARTMLEVVLAYPGLHAIWIYRVAHWLWEHHCKLLGRLVSEFARLITGIEIHPGATIGRRLFIDHGMGIVMGETTEIGDDVLIYQGVTLGGTSLKKEKRHPTIEDHVMVSAGASVIGPVRIGEGSRIGAGAVVVSSCPPWSTVVGIPGKVIEGDNTRHDVTELDHAQAARPGRACDGQSDRQAQPDRRADGRNRRAPGLPRGQGQRESPADAGSHPRQQGLAIRQPSSAGNPTNFSSDAACRGTETP